MDASAGTYDGRQMRLYVNSNNCTNQYNFKSEAINAFVSEASGHRYFDGIIRDVRIYCGPKAAGPFNWLNAATCLKTTERLFEKLL